MIFQVIKSVFPLLIIILFGIFGFYFIENWSFFDSFYMTVISLTTVGFGEIHPLSFYGKIFTVILLLTGVGSVTLVARNLSLQFFQPFFGTVLKEKKMEKILSKMQNHYIVCGHGRIGRDVCKNLTESQKKVVVVDKNISDFISINGTQVPVVQGDASYESTLLKAGIDRAKGLIAAVTSEAENVFITMTARDLNPDLFIISRFEENATQSKLLRAGANKVINPYHIGSQKISHIILKPTISKILDFAYEKGQFQLDINELELKDGNKLIGNSIRECKIRDDYNIIIIAIEKSDGIIITNPGPNYVFENFDRIVMIANDQEIQTLFKKYKGNKKK